MDGDTADEILHATYRALCEHGYADLTLQDIAAETDTSTAAIHYHYGSKSDLFAAFLEFLYERYGERIESVAGDAPRERLQSLVAALLASDDGGPDGEFRTAMLEVRAQAPYDDAIREQLRRFDDLLFEEIRTIVADGVDDGTFDPSADPDQTAEFLTTAISGAHTRHVAVGTSMDRTRGTIRRYVETQLVDAPEVPT